MDSMQKLAQLKNSGGEVITQGLPDSVIREFLGQDPLLGEAIDDALSQFERVEQEIPEIAAAAEADQMRQLQAGFVNFYTDDAINPYVALAARGPWLITSKGAVVYDCGGYGMLGLGHAPKAIREAMNRPHVMANIMTPSFGHHRLIEALRSEIGQRAGRGCPFDRFLCLNSGSEAVSVAARISDINARTLTDMGGRHHGRKVKVLSLKGGFHGRTDRPAQFSDSTQDAYQRFLHTFREFEGLITVEPNNLDQLRQVFQEADEKNLFIEAMFLEPVMGEGNPGMAINPEFYQLARELTRERDTLLLVDSIQAGLRTHGCLSIVDYPGFENLDPPDMETYSKALNGGQFPLSVLAMTRATAKLYQKGVYGNTMTANPRAMDVACAVLTEMTQDRRANIVARGRELVEKLEGLRAELGGLITMVQGTGLLVSCALDPSFKIYGTGSVEEHMRKAGVGVIHGGKHSVRYTPHFGITSAEVDLIVAATKEAILHEPRLAAETV